MREPTRRLPVSGPGWNDRAAVALLVLVTGRLLAGEPPPVAGPLIPDRLAPLGGAYQNDLPALLTALAKRVTSTVSTSGLAEEPGIWAKDARSHHCTAC